MNRIQRILFPVFFEKVSTVHRASHMRWTYDPPVSVQAGDHIIQQKKAVYRSRAPRLTRRLYGEVDVAMEVTLPT